MHRRAFVTLLLALTLWPGLAPAQTPKTLDVDNARVSRTWTIVGYEVLVPDPADPLGGSIGIRYSLVTQLGDEVLSTEQRSATVSGTKALQALFVDIETRVRQQIAANEPNAYFVGTRAALYAWLQANGHIDEAAR